MSDQTLDQKSGQRQLSMNELKAVAYNINAMVNEFINIINQQAVRIAELEKKIVEKTKE